MYDVIIIGAGIIGSSVARNLSKYNLDILVIDKENDVSNGTTKANSAIVHAGYDAEPNSLKAYFNVKGNEIMEDLCKELDVPFERIGSYVLALNDNEISVLENLKQSGIENGVPGLEIISKEEIKKREPNISDNVVAALYAPTGGIVGPWELAIAMMENAMDNGVDLKLNQKVLSIEKLDSGYEITTNRDKFQSKYVINAAGVYADDIHNMVAKPKFKITPRKGEYYLLDKKAGDHVNSVIFQSPSDLGKGVVVLPTIHGNLLIGPDAQNLDDKLNLSTNSENLKYVKESANKAVKDIPYWDVITSFVGLRAGSDIGDFIIEEIKDAPGFIDVAGIESPGLTAAPAIGEYVASLLKNIDKNFAINKNFNPTRRIHYTFMELSDEEKIKLIKKDSKYGNIICRCENVTEGEIVDIIHRNAGATTIDGVKRRARPGGGRCQGGFCQPKVMEILARELNIDITEVLKDKLGSNVAIEETKEWIQLC